MVVSPRVLFTTTPTAVTSPYFTEKMRAFFPNQIARDEKGNLLIGADVVAPYDPISGAMRARMVLQDPTYPSQIAQVNTFADGAYNDASNMLIGASVLEYVNPTTPANEYARAINRAGYGSASAAGSTSFWAGVAGKYHRILGMTIMIPGGCTQAAAGNNVIQVIDNATVVWQGAAYVSNAAQAKDTVINVTFNPNGLKSQTVNTAWNLNLGTALTAGNVYVSYWGCEE